MKNALNTYSLSELYIVKESLEDKIKIAEEVGDGKKVKESQDVLVLVKEVIEKKKTFK
jgi:hypothetical protein